MSGWNTSKVKSADYFLEGVSTLVTWKVNSSLSVTVNSPNCTVNFEKTSYTYESGVVSYSESY